MGCVAYTLADLRVRVGASPVLPQEHHDFCAAEPNLSMLSPACCPALAPTCVMGLAAALPADLSPVIDRACELTSFCLMLAILQRWCDGLAGALPVYLSPCIYCPDLASGSLQLDHSAEMA